MQTIDITAKATKIIRLGLLCVLVPALVIGYAEFRYWHHDETITLPDAKVVGTMVSVRVLANGKVKELPFEDGAEVKAGDVIARLEVNITPEEIAQLEESVKLARDNYATLQEGQWVRVPVQRERVVDIPATTSAPSGNLAKLEERANRMAELFEMGAVSAVQRDAARRAYESALSQGTSGGGGGGTRVEYYTEYVDEFRPTPAEVLAGAEQAIKQAELTLNVAKQEARETDVIAPVSGTIYYGTEVDKDLSAGESVARIGDSGELWIEAEVTEDVFDRIALGKLVSYVIDGKELSGTVTEKIKPDPEPEPVELPDIPTTTNAPAPLIGDQPAAENPSPKPDTQPAAENPSPKPDAQSAAENPSPKPDAQPRPPKLPEGTEGQAKPNDKFIIKISMPADRDFDCRPNTTTAVKIRLS
ncbi:MAG: HlyD family efflux transporter periplasmic adaptor subunit [Quinella sp. 2Q5]|nr:HlyD family efflux transporter periplasmic adaptor subunit [Quinella sp. 2Q5]